MVSLVNEVSAPSAQQGRVRLWDASKSSFGKRIPTRTGLGSCSMPTRQYELRDGRFWRAKEYVDEAAARVAFERPEATAHAAPGI
jgi:hypothetical protein